MTDWADVKRFVHANYNAEDISDTAMKLVFNTSGLRSQIVFIEYAFNDSGKNWIKVNSPVGPVDRVNLRRAAEYLSERLAGGLIVQEGYACVTNAVPLLNLDANEIVEPLELVTLTADMLESELLGEDVL